MDVTIMPSTLPLLEIIRAEHPDIIFTHDDHFEWQPKSRTILYDSDDSFLEAHLLHELSHALLNHEDYERDIDLIAMERDAWQMAKVDLAPKYDVIVTGDILHHDMDTYREWLHARSTCPHCGSNGIQIKKSEYKCVTCLKTWRVNEARNCQLRRYRL
jgi:tRNA(Ile2) C34 agmatinyltransferase TiaS